MKAFHSSDTPGILIVGSAIEGAFHFVGNTSSEPIGSLVSTNPVQKLQDEPHAVVATASPAMDIQVSSNFERLLFEAYDRNSVALRGLMAALAKDKRFTISSEALDAIRRVFSAGRADEAETVGDHPPCPRGARLCAGSAQRRRRFGRAQIRG